MSDNDPEQRPSEPTGPIRWTQASWPATPSTAAQSTIDQMTDQLQSVIGAAERAAEAIRRDAEEQARLHLAEAQRKADRLTAERVGLISELTDDLIRHAENVRDHSEQMVRALEAAIDSVTDKLEQPALSDWLDGPGSPPAFGAADQRTGDRDAPDDLQLPTEATADHVDDEAADCCVDESHSLRLASPLPDLMRHPRLQREQLDEARARELAELPA